MPLARSGRVTSTDAWWSVNTSSTLAGGISFNFLAAVSSGMGQLSPRTSTDTSAFAHSGRADSEETVKTLTNVGERGLINILRLMPSFIEVALAGIFLVQAREPGFGVPLLISGTGRNRLERATRDEKRREPQTGQRGDWLEGNPRVPRQLQRGILPDDLRRGKERHRAPARKPLPEGLSLI